jgi:conjugal transfer mating pair stabilization protein TraG
MYEVYAYWNVAELEAMFNAVAAIMGSGDYLGLLRTMAIVGVIVVVIATLSGRERLDGMWKWLFFLAIFQALLLVPKVTVTIVDRTGNEPPRAVANVPIGLGAFAHAMSKVGDWLTGAFETVFSLPDDVRFRKNGTLFGHRVLAERLAVKSGNPILTSNLLEFYRECVAPDVATGYIRMKEDIIEVNNVWASLNGKTNPARLVTVRDISDPMLLNTVGCDVAYQSLSTQLTAESNRQLTLLGSRLYPKMSQADAGAAIVASLATSTNYLLGVAASAQDAVKQAIVANFMIDAQYLVPAQLGDAASAQTNLAMAQSLRSTSDSYKLMARIAESTMPKVRNAIELVQYAIFPVFLLFVVISGHQAGAIIKSYATSLFWIQLWAPLYAVMNFIITMYSRSHYTNGSAGGGLAIEQMSFLNTAIISDQAIAGMLVISIPAIAAAIVKGGEVGLQAVAGLVAPPRDPEKIASALAMGNMQMGHASLNNVSHDTQKGLTVDMNPSLRQGMTNYQARGGFDYSHFSGGGFVVRQGKSDVRADMALNDSLGAAAKENYERSQQATRQHSAEYAESALAALKQEAGFERSHSQGSSDGTGYRHGMGSSRNHEANDSLRQVDQWAKKLGVSEKVAMEMMIGASMGMNTPKLLEIAGLRGGWSSPPSCATLPTPRDRWRRWRSSPVNRALGKRSAPCSTTAGSATIEAPTTAGLRAARGCVHHWITRGSRAKPSAPPCRKRKGIGRCGSCRTAASWARTCSSRIISSRISCCPSSISTTRHSRGSWATRTSCARTSPNIPRRTTTGCSARWPVRSRGQMQSAPGTRRIAAAFPVPLRSGRRGKATGDR